jgi:hypothetical protein
VPATLRVAVAFAAKGCSRTSPPLPLKPSESEGSGDFLFSVHEIGGVDVGSLLIRELPSCEGESAASH